LCRKIAKDVLATGNKDEKILVTAKKVHKLLGPPRFRYGRTEERDDVGPVTGLAWSQVRGHLLPTEVAVRPAQRNLTRQPARRPDARERAAADERCAVARGGVRPGPEVRRERRPAHPRGGGRGPPGRALRWSAQGAGDG